MIFTCSANILRLFIKLCEKLDALCNVVNVIQRKHKDDIFKVFYFSILRDGIVIKIYWDLLFI
jgi:hypothetical protein